MKIAAVSDTHGNLEGLRKAVKEILGAHEIALFVHLGDEYEDAEVFDEYACEYLRVPGVYDHRYRDRAIPNRILKEFEGWRFLMSHTDTAHSNDLPDDLRPEELVAGRHIDCLLYGHSHRPEARVKSGLLLLNPGHLKKEDSKGFPASYAIVSIGRSSVAVIVKGLGSGKVLGEATLRRSRER